MIIKFLLIALSIILFPSCSSSTSRENSSNSNKPSGLKANKVVQVEQINKADLKKRGMSEKEMEMAIRNSGFASKRQWYKMQEEYTEFNNLRNKGVQELKQLLNSADTKTATVIIEALSQKGPTAVEPLINVLGDKRIAKFEEGDRIYWYEEKNKPPQDIELRLFAALHLEKMVNTSPYGVSFDFHQIKTDKGPVDVLYAVKGSYAVTKDDVCKAWLKWWSNYGGDYK